MPTASTPDPDPTMARGPTVTMLGGGVGCSRLAVPLAAQLGSGDLTLVINTADDLWRYGLRICPDIDTNLYALAGLQDRVSGWGLAGDTFRAMDRLRELGEDPWFNLGDRDLATHILRTGLLDEELSLTEVIAEMTRRLAIDTRVLPMTDSEVGTVLTTASGTYPFQEWFVKLRATGPVERVRYEGIERAEATSEVIRAIVDADLVVIGPSNPVVSIEPILAIPGIRDLLIARRSSVVAVTPIISAVPIVNDGEAHRARARKEQMQTRGLVHEASAVACLYRQLAGTFVLDRGDEAQRSSIEANDQHVELADTIISDEESGRRLAAALLSVRRRR
jgi:LPPG:FO 2-phospho-L-lactate transferase